MKYCFFKKFKGFITILFYLGYLTLMKEKKAIKAKNLATSAVCSNCRVSSKDSPSLDFIKDQEGVVLCSKCIDFFSTAKKEIIQVREDKKESKAPVVDLGKLPSPEDIFDHLNLSVIAQEEAKKSISIAVAHHYRRMKDPSIGKSNILLIGPTGTGKTEIARTIAAYLKVPFASGDATSFTAKGYVGEDVDSVIQRLLVSCDWDISKAETGIVFIDEIDKIARRGGADNHIGTMAVQQELLRLMEGDKIKINRPNPNSPTGHDPVYVDTQRILFICAGAFVGIEEVIKNSGSKTIGLDRKEEELKSGTIGELVESKHLNNYGLLPELLGRLPVIASTQALKEEDLIRILTEPKNSIVKQYQSLFSLDSVKVEFSPEFLSFVAKESIKKEIGARGLRQIIEKKMKELFFNIKKYKNKTLIIQPTDVIVKGGVSKEING